MSAPSAASEAKPLPLVSVVVPTKNSAPYLERCLESIRAQSYSRVEIVVVDNHSTDATVEIARRYADVVASYGPERCAQINEGVRRSHGDYVYRVDGDFVLDRTVIETAVAACSNGIELVAIHNDSSPDVSFWSRVRRLERQMYRDDDLVVGVRFFSRHAFDDVGGFDETLVAGEDFDIHNRLLRKGYAFRRIEPGELHLGEPRTLGEIARKSFFYGRTMRRFLRTNGRRGLAQIMPWRDAFVRNRGLFSQNAAETAGFVLVKLTQYGAGLAGLLTAYIRPEDR